HRFGAETHRHCTSLFGPNDQARLVEHVQMLHDCWELDGERLRQVADRSAFLALEARKDGPPCRINQRRKGAVELVGSIVHHVVKYLACAGVVKRKLGRSWFGGAQESDPVRFGRMQARLGISVGPYLPSHQVPTP